MSILFALRPARVSSARLLELERILTHDRAPRMVTGERRVDPVALHLADVPTERIVHFTQALRSSDAEFTENDDVDVLTMRLLLNDFITAVGHLRAVAEIAGSLVDKAASPVQDSRRFLEREDRWEEKMRLRRPPGTGPASADG